MRSIHAVLFAAGALVGCAAVKTPPRPEAAAAAAANSAEAQQAMMQRPSAASMGRRVASLRDVQTGDRISVLQYVDKTETWVTGQVQELTEERLTLVQCDVEARNYQKKEGGMERKPAARYSLPPKEVRAIRIP